MELCKHDVMLAWSRCFQTRRMLNNIYRNAWYTRYAITICDCFCFFTQRRANYSCTGCGGACGLRTSPSGNFSDGSGSANYSHNAYCEWMIASTNGSVITIQFTNFSTQPINDVVRVFQCSDVYCSQQQQLAELSGTYLSTQVMTSATGYMRVVFTSDGSINHAGFAASWSSVS
jgi:hypothetical protein